MGQSHAGHSHGVGAGAPSGKRRIWPMAFSAVLIGGFFVVELVTGILVNSLALIADAGHMLTDLVALLMGLTALLLGRHGRTTDSRSFGWHRAEVFTAVANAVLLYGVAIYVLYEAIRRIGDAPEIPGVPMIVVAILGLLANVVVMVLLRGDSQDSIAVRGAYMEVLADAVGSVGVLVAGAVVLTTGWGYADIVVAVFIAIWVVPRATRLAIDAFRILNQQAPQNVDVEKLRADLAAIPSVTDVHDLHVWSLTTGMDVATVHLVSDNRDADVLRSAQAILDGYGLAHATIQVDSKTDKCRTREELSW
ncbi:cation diffusion facilitator family transporter [Gordonia sinesedis]